MATYDIGDRIRLSTSIQVLGVDTDPTALTLKVRDPSGNVDTYTYGQAQIDKDSAGDYHKDVTVDEAGTWYFRFIGTSPAEGAGESHIWVRPSEF